MPDSPAFIFDEEVNFCAARIKSTLIWWKQSPFLGSNIPWIETFVAFLTYFFVVTLIQHLTGAVKSSFGLYPDEPSHYLSSLLVHDYLLSGFHENPLTFAVKYYTALPYFAVGYWPPAFYLIGGIWMSVFGIQRPSALALIAVVAALLATTVYRIVRRNVRSRFLAGIWALVVLLIPQVIDSSSMYMLDLPVALFSLWALIEEIRYLKEPDRPWHAILFALWASLTFLTKYSGGFVFGFPFAGVIVSRKWRCLRKKWFWTQFLVSGFLCAPWVIYTRRLVAVGLPSTTNNYVHISFIHAVLAFQQGLINTLGLTITLAVILALVFCICKIGLNFDVLMCAAAPLCLIAFLLLTPVYAEDRYFLPTMAPIVLLIAYSLPNVSFGRARFAKTAIPLFLCVAGIVQCAWKFPHYPVDPFPPLIRYVSQNPQWRHASILLPSGCEGAAIADFAGHEQHRPSQVLLRPSKILANADWWGIHKLRFSSVSKLRKQLLQDPIDLIVLNPGKSCAHTAVDPLLSATMKQSADDWKQVATFSPGWEVYASAEPSDGLQSIYTQRTLNRLHSWHAAAEAVTKGNGIR